MKKQEKTPKKQGKPFVTCERLPEKKNQDRKPGQKVSNVAVGFISGLIACGKNDKEIAEVMNISPQAVNGYRRKYINGELDQLITERAKKTKDTLPDMLMLAINQLLPELMNAEKLGKLTPDKAAVTIGILIDKYRLITNQSTSNSHSIISYAQSQNDPRLMIDD